MAQRQLTQLEDLPTTLSQYIVEQDYALYTPMDQACWRYILHVNTHFFAQHAHPKYLNGLALTGISTERIPDIEEMDRCLQKFGWRAAPVSGFIPPSVFLELQACGVLPIACDMRKLENLAYTPAPDIVHEAAGHAPLLTEPEFAAYLRNYGEIARKAIYFAEDVAVYEAIRHLSIVKEDPFSTPKAIQEAEQSLNEALAQQTEASESTLLSRIAWWSIEYGLISINNINLIYGAGLLSSAGESYECLKPHVTKLPFTVTCAQTNYDITKPQPQLFVTPDFQHLDQVLTEFSQQMAYTRGGKVSLERAQRARTVTTSVLDSGLQVSGLLTECEYINDTLAFLKFEGPTQLAYADRELNGHGTATHAHGFSSPVGLVAGFNKSAALLSDSELSKLGFRDGHVGHLTFESGIELTGRLTGKTHEHGRNLILSFEDCQVRRGERVYYDPSWGVFDLACGHGVVSVFGGTADRKAYAASATPQISGRHKTNLTPKNKTLNSLYLQVRNMREQKSLSVAQLEKVASAVMASHPTDWLLSLEILELLEKSQLGTELAERLREHLRQNTTDQLLIQRGVEALGLSL